MNSRFEGSRQARSSKLAAGLILAGTLLIVGVTLSVLPWPRFVQSGWLMGGMLFLGGVMGNALSGRRGLPDAADVASALWSSIGTLTVLVCLMVAAVGRL